MRPVHRLFRLLLYAVCLAGIFVAWTDHRTHGLERDELVSLLQEVGFDRRAGGVVDRVEHERSIHHARVLTARGLVYAVLDAVPADADPVAADGSAALRVGSPAWRAAVDRLPRAAELSRRALVSQPNHWQASMLLGAAIYLDRSLAGDSRLITDAPAWEEPLALALDQAPGQIEPRRFLAAAYLEMWSVLSSSKKDLTRWLLGEVFRHDERAFDRLAPTWLDVAGDLDEAFSVMPDRPAVWRRLEGIYARGSRWEAFCRAHERREAIVFSLGAARLEDAEERLRLGDLFGGRSLLLRTIAEAPLAARFAPQVARALELYPPGLHGLSSTEPLADWLYFSLELASFDRSLLPPEVVGRLAGAVGELPPPEAARAAVLAGEIPQAERLERLAQRLASPVWGPYLVAKARWHLDHGRLDAAAVALAPVAPEIRRTLPFALVEAELARRQGDPAAVAEVERRLDTWRRRAWTASGWRFRDGRPTLALLPAEPAEGLAVTLNEVPPSGAVVEVYLDGRRVALEPVRGDGELTVLWPITAQAHLLELRVLAGGGLFPGRVRLLDDAAPEG